MSAFLSVLTLPIYLFVSFLLCFGFVLFCFLSVLRSFACYLEGDIFFYVVFN